MGEPLANETLGLTNFPSQVQCHRLYQLNEIGPFQQRFHFLKFHTEYKVIFLPLIHGLVAVLIRYSAAL